MEHAKKSLSASPRWSKCAGSIREEANYPDTSGPAAIDGTGSHVLLELILKGDVREIRGGRFAKTTSYIGETVGLGHKDKTDGWLVDKERLARVMIAVNYIEQQLDHFGTDVQLFVERKTNPGAKYFIDDLWGTVDITIITGDHLEVIDYKDGFTKVSEHTTQLLAYASGQVDFANDHNIHIKKVQKTIIQPKSGEQIRSVTHSLEQNDRLFKDLAHAAILTEASDAPLTAGEHCRWCKHKLNCLERNQTATSAINHPTRPADMTNEQLSEANDRIPMIKDLIGLIRAETEKRLLCGEHVPNYKMDTRVGNRIWLDDEQVSKKLKTLVINGQRLKSNERQIVKPMSPIAVLALDLTTRQRQTFESLITRRPGVERLIRVDSKEAKKKPTIDEMFGNDHVNENSNNFKVTFDKNSIINNSEIVEMRTIRMTDKAKGATAEDFRLSSSDWTDEFLVGEGYAVWLD